MKKLFFLMMIVCVAGCKKSNQQSDINNPVQSIPVNITIYPNDPTYFTVQAIGGWKYIPGGLNGIILYRKSNEEFVAVERSSTYLPNNANAKVLVQNDNFTLQDTVSKSTWRIFDGTVIKGPATWHLRLYGTSFDGSTLIIKN